MVSRKNNALVLASLLAAAALICLGVGLRLLAAGSDGPQPTSDIGYLSTLVIVGGVVIFLLGTIVLLAARRFAVGRSPSSEPLPADLGLLDIREWSRELADIRDDLRGGLAGEMPDPGIELREFEIPNSWQPHGRYVLGDDGRPAYPLADLKRTRDQLLAAATRVDTIVQNINEATSNHCDTTIYKTERPKRGRWDIFRRK